MQTRMEQNTSLVTWSTYWTRGEANANISEDLASLLPTRQRPELTKDNREPEVSDHVIGSG